jgi:hypothetical protein
MCARVPGLTSEQIDTFLDDGHTLLEDESIFSTMILECKIFEVSLS